MSLQDKLLATALHVIPTSVYMLRKVLLLDRLFVWFLTTHQPLWVISVRRYLTKHVEDRKSKNL